jgi:hypothetical protein
VSAALGKTSTDGVLGGLDTVHADLSLEHSFGIAGIRMGAAYWGDNDLLDSNDLRGALFLRGGAGSLSFDYERRDFAFTFVPVLEPDTTRTVRFSANGVGGSAWLNATDRVGLFVNGMSYEYSRNLRIQQDFDSLRVLSRSRLSLINSLMDYRVSGGVSVEIGDKALDLSLSRWQTAVDGGHVNSVSIGLAVPASRAFDVDIRLAYDDAEYFDSTVALAVTLIYFGG